MCAKMLKKKKNKVFIPASVTVSKHSISGLKRSYKLTDRNTTAN